RDKLPCGYLLALLNFELREMHVNGHQALAMVQHDAISLEIQRPGQDHLPCVRGMDRRADTRAKIQPLVLGFLHPVYNSRRAEDAGSLCVSGSLKRTRPKGIWICRCEC